MCFSFSIALLLAPRVARAGELAPREAPAAPVAPTPPARPARVEPSAPIAPDVALSADINGQFGDLRCGGRAEVFSLRAVSSRLQRVGDEALRVDAGNLFSAAGLAQIAMECCREPLVNALVSLRLHAAALGHRDLSADRRALTATLARLARTRGAPRMVLSNLHCDEGHRDLCADVLDADDPPALFETPRGRAAVVSAVSPDVLENLSQRNREGLTLDEPVAALQRAVSAARRAGARWVIAVYDPRSGDELADALGVEARLATDEAQQPDLLVVNRVAENMAFAGRIGMRHTVAASRPGEVVRLPRLDARALHRIEPTRPARAVEALGDTLRRQVCTQFSRPLAGATLGASLDREDFSRAILDVLRERTGADVAVLNLGAVRPTTRFPLTGALTELDLLTALPFENELRVATVSGAQLREFMQRPARARFVVRGLIEGERDDEYVINGRPLEDSVDYVLVTTDFVADGGNGGFPEASDVRFRAIPDATVRNTVRAWLSRRRDEPIERALVDPAQRTRWLFRVGLSLGLNQTHVSNPDTAAFADAQLTRAAAIALTGQFDLRADADHPVYTWENLLRLQYGLASTDNPDGGDSGLSETADLITARSTGVLRGLFGPRRWYVPSPYADLYAESEFTLPSTRTYRHLELRPVAGLRWDLTRRLSLAFGAGASAELLATRESYVPSGGAPAAGVLLGSVSLRPWRLWKVGENWAEVQGSFDAALRDALGTPDTTMRLHLQVFFPIVSALSISATYDLFARGLGGPEGTRWAVAGDLIVSLDVSWTRALQAFRF